MRRHGAGGDLQPSLPSAAAPSAQEYRALHAGMEVPSLGKGGMGKGR